MSSNFFIRLKIRILFLIAKRPFIRRLKQVEDKTPGLLNSLKNMPGESQEERMNAYNELRRNLN